MITWNNLDTLASYQELSKAEKVNLAEAMNGENGADRGRRRYYRAEDMEGVEKRQGTETSQQGI